jgi:hypothetical protein
MRPMREPDVLHSAGDMWYKSTEMPVDDLGRKEFEYEKPKYTRCTLFLGRGQVATSQLLTTRRVSVL